MANFSVVAVSKRTIEALQNGEIDAAMSYKLFTAAAQEQFPDCKNVAEATEKFRQTEHGQAWFAAERQAVHYKMQTDSALGSDAALIAKFAKLGGGPSGAPDNPASRQSRPGTPEVETPSEAPRSNGAMLPRLTVRNYSIRRSRICKPRITSRRMQRSACCTVPRKRRSLAANTQTRSRCMPSPSRRSTTMTMMMNPRPTKSLG